MADKNTKRVAGEDLESSAFAYVGDAKKKSTWKLPIKFKSEAKTKRHIRKAIARFDQTDMPNASEKAKAWERITAAAKKYGIEIADEKDGKKSSMAEMQRQLQARVERLAKGAVADPESDDPALAWDSERDADAGDGAEEIESLPMLRRDFQILDMAPIYRGDGDELEEYGQEGQQQGAKTKKARDADNFDMSLSSEIPVERLFGREILDHSPEAVDMSRAKLGLPFLDSHDAKAVIGVIEDLRVEDKKLRGRVRFSRNAPAQAVKQDMLDGIRKFTSVGYAVLKMDMVESSKEKGDTYRVTRWMPMEGSSVAIPADTTVGFGRARDDAQTYPVEVTREANHETRSTSDAPTGAPTPTVPAEPAAASEAARGRSITVEAQVKESLQAAAEIMRLGQLHKIEQETIEKWVSEGRSVADVSKEILARIERGQKVLNTPAPEQAVDLTPKDQDEYRISRLIMAAADRAEGRRETNCLELEISEEIRKQFVAAGRTIKSAGVFFPSSIRHSLTPEIAAKFPHLGKRIAERKAEMQQRAGLFTGGSTVGQTLVFTEPGEFIRFLYNRTRVVEAGARTLSGLRDNISFPKQTGRATGSWVTENPGADVADSNLTLGSVASSPKTYQSSSSYSRQLLAQATIDVDTLVREDLVMDLSLALDSVAVQGGGSNQPKGILTTTGVQSYVDAADVGNGGAMVWADYIAMKKLLEEVNADQLGDPSWLTTPQVKASAKTTARLGNTIGLPIWADDNTVDGNDARWTNQVPSSLAKGTSGNTLSALILGVFNTMVIGQWGSGFEMIVDPYRLKKQGMIEITTFMLSDVVLRYPVAFVANQAVIAS